MMRFSLRYSTSTSSRLSLRISSSSSWGRRLTHSAWDSFYVDIDAWCGVREDFPGEAPYCISTTLTLRWNMACMFRCLRRRRLYNLRTAGKKTKSRSELAFLRSSVHCTSTGTLASTRPARSSVGLLLGISKRRHRKDRMKNTPTRMHVGCAENKFSIIKKRKFN